MGVGFEGEVADTMRLCQSVQRQESEKPPDEALPEQCSCYTELLAEKMTKERYNLKIKLESQGLLIALSETFDPAHVQDYKSYLIESLEQKIRDSQAEASGKTTKSEGEEVELKIKLEQEASGKKEQIDGSVCKDSEEVGYKEKGVANGRSVVVGNNKAENSGEKLEAKKQPKDLEGGLEEDGRKGILEEGDVLPKSVDLSGGEEKLLAADVFPKSEEVESLDNRLTEQDEGTVILDKAVSGIEEVVPATDILPKSEEVESLDKESKEQNSLLEKGSTTIEGKAKGEEKVIEDLKVEDLLKDLAHLKVVHRTMSADKDGSLETKKEDFKEEKSKHHLRKKVKRKVDTLKEIRDSNKAERNKSRQRISQAPLDVKNADIKVKKAANETNGGGGGGQINQSKAGSHMPAVGRKFAAKCGNGACGDGDEEEEEDGRRRRNNQYKKHLDCYQPGAKKKNSDERNRLPPGARPKGPGRKLPESGDISGQLGMLSLRNPLSTSKVGPAGDEWHSNSPQKSLPCTSSNKKAFKQLYRDNGVNTLHKIQHKAGAAEQDSESPEEPMEVGSKDEEPHSVDILQRVNHGRPRDIIAFAHYVEGLKTGNSKLQELPRGFVFGENLAASYSEGQYTKLKALGMGSFGNVYLVQIRNSGYVVDKQIMLLKFAPNEAILWCELAHPNILPFLGLIFSDGMVTLLTEYYPCQTLQQLIKKEGVLGQGRALEIIRQVFEALVYLQKKHIVHKDIKPDNVLISSEGRIQLIDFGAAVRLEKPFYEGEAPKGTECYMAPEIAGSTSYDHRADVWSAICTLICLISGSPPWAKRFQQASLKIFIIFVRAAPLEDIPPNTHPEVRRFIEMTLVKEVNQRPTAAQALDLIPLDVVDEIYNAPAIESPAESDPKPVVECVGIPDNAFAGPQTPQTPRGPEDKHPHLAPGILNVDDLMSPFFLPQEDNCDIEDGSPHSVSMEGVESGPSDQPIKPASASMEVDDSDDEDMYGPPPANDVQEEYDDIVISLPDRSDDASCNQRDRRLISRGIGGGSQNKEATSSYICDDSNPSGLSGENQGSSSSFEVDMDSPEGEGTSLGTAFDEMLEFGKVPSPESLGSDEVDHGGAFRGAARSSGFDSRRPSSEEEKEPSGVFVTVFMENTEQVDRMIAPQFTVQELAQEIVILPEFRNLRLATQQITLVLKQTGHTLPLDHTFTLGKHELVAMPMSDVINWLWSIDVNGIITMA